MTDNRWTPPTKCWGQLPLKQVGLLQLPGDPVLGPLGRESRHGARGRRRSKQLAPRGTGRDRRRLHMAASPPSTRSAATGTSRPTSTSTAASLGQPPDPSGPLCRLAARRGGPVHAALDERRGRLHESPYLRDPFADTLKNNGRRDAGVLADDRVLRYPVQPPRPVEDHDESETAELKAEFGDVWTPRTWTTAVDGRTRVRDRHAHHRVGRAVRTDNQRRNARASFRPRLHRSAEAGSDHEGAEARRGQALPRRRDGPVARVPQRRRCMDLRAPGGEDVDHRVGHLAGPRLPLAHPDGCDADDDVHRASREVTRSGRCSSLSRSNSSTSISSCSSSRSSSNRSRHRLPSAGPMPLARRCSTATPRTSDFFDLDPLTRAEEHTESTSRTSRRQGQGLGHLPARGVLDHHLDDLRTVREGRRGRALHDRPGGGERYRSAGMDHGEQGSGQGQCQAA